MKKVEENRKEYHIAETPYTCEIGVRVMVAPEVFRTCMIQ